MRIKLTIVLIFIIVNLSSLIINIPADFTTIQNGINHSADGDTVLVAPGTYFENINCNGKAILLSSHFLINNDMSFIEQTIVDGSNPTNPDTTSTVVFCNNETESAIIQGFTIKNGGGTVWIDPQYPTNTWFSGGGIFICYSSPTIRYNHIKENIVENDGSFDGASGGGLLSFRGNPLITNNSISLNQAEYGAGIVVDYSGAIIKNNLIINNSGGSLYGGGGLYFIGNDTNPVIVENNTLFANHSNTTGGAMQMWGSSINSINNIIWGNTQVSGPQINGYATSSITYCCVENGFSGEGNIDLDPLFINEELFILNENSPCIDAGNPDENYYDPEDFSNPGMAKFPSQGTIINDMGVYGGPLTTCFQPTSIGLCTVPNPVINITNYPNPFNPSTTIMFQLNTETSETIELIIYNLKGQKIRQFAISNNQSKVIWDGRDEKNQPVSSGIYLYKLKLDNYSQARKMILLK